MSIDSYLQSAIVRTSLGDHGLAAWHSGNSGPLVNATGVGTLEAVLLWKAIPDPGQEDSEYPSGTVSFKRQGVDADFSEPVHVPNMWRAAGLLGIGYNWEYTAENHPEVAAWLKGDGPIPAIDSDALVLDSDVLRSETKPERRTSGRTRYRSFARERAKARKDSRASLLRLLGPEWVERHGRVHCGDTHIRVVGWKAQNYAVCFQGSRMVVFSAKALKAILWRLGLPVAA